MSNGKYTNNFITATTFLWHDPTRDQNRNYKCGVEHVVIWRNMIKRNLTMPHEHVCVTNREDWAQDLERNGIRAVPLDMSKHVPGTVYVRLFMRRPDIGGILGPRIFMTDLDVVVVDNIDSIVDRTEPSVFWRNPNWVPNDPDCKRAFYQSSIQLFSAGSHSCLYTEFDPEQTPRWANRRFGGREQAWISERLPWDEAYWTKDDGVYGAGRLGDTSPGVDVRSTALPVGAKIVSCPGQRAPWQEEFMEIHPWAKEFYK